MSNENERMRILQMIETGQITAAEAMQRLKDLAAAADQARVDEAAFRPDPLGEAEKAPPDPEIDKWKRWWIIPMWIGVGIILAGGLLMDWALQASGVGFWFFCAWLPFLLGIGLTALAWSSRSSRWIHVRVKTGEEQGPRNIAISLPFPTRVVAWAVRTFGARLPALKRTAVDELILALDETTSSDTPLYVDVTEGDKGERVQVYFG